MDVLKVFYVQAVVAALALCVVRQGHEARHIGYRLEELRRETRVAVVENQKCTAQISRLKNPQRIVRLVETLGLGLGEPPAVPDTPGEPAAPEARAGTSTPPVAAADGIEH